jgi:PhzF family phenazine biosynthesis protein
MNKAHIAFISAFCSPDNQQKGNVSAVISLETAITDKQMQAIASDLNQPATTFLIPNKNGYSVRWFAPDTEIGLCGHGSMAALAYMDWFEKSSSDIRLESKAGGNITGAKIASKQYELKLEAIGFQEASKAPEGLSQALGVPIQAYHMTKNKDLVILSNEDELRLLKPDFSALKRIDVFGYAVTAKGTTSDFVSRTLVPHVQQLEDHATGSSHAALVPYWAQRLQNNSLTAIQLSPRGGLFACQLSKEHVILGGHCRLIAEGKIKLN